MKYNYHTHTFYCNHADGTVDDVVNRALEYGLLEIGFSEHQPIMQFEGWRIADIETLEKYLDDVYIAKEKYKDQIKIFAGLEVEPRSSDGTDLIEWISSLSKNKRIEYLIVGHHHYSDGSHVFSTFPTREMLEKYVDDLRRLLTEVNILYIAHPDALIRGAGQYNEDVLWAFQQIIDLSIEFDCPLGINVNGYKVKTTEFNYPNDRFFKMSLESGAITTIELDTHSMKTWNKNLSDEVEFWANDLKLNVIDKIKISGE